MKPEDRDHLHSLLSAVVDNTIDEPELAKLANLLESDNEARRFYVQYMDMHAALSASAAHPLNLPRSRRPWYGIVASALAAAAALMLAWATSFLGRPAEIPVVPEAKSVANDASSNAGYVATIVSASNESELNGKPVIAAERLTPGTYDLAQGQLSLQFDGGAHVFFDGPARFTLQSRRRLQIDRGTFLFEGDQSCESIEITTPHSIFRNLGTRYAAVVTAEGEDLHVAKGTVQRTIGRSTPSPQHELIEAGAGRRYVAATDDNVTIPLDEALVERTPEPSTVEHPAARPWVADDFRGNQERIRGLRSGYGWAEPWRSLRDDWQLVSPGLGAEGSFAVQHNGISKNPAAQRAAAHRLLETPIDLSRDGIWYLRFLVRRGRAQPKDEHLAMVVLRSHGLSAQEEINQGALIQIALRREEVAMVRLGGSLNRVSLPQTPDQTYAVVAKIVCGRTKPEQVLVRVMAADRLAKSKEPMDWSLVSESVHTDIKIEQVSLECVSGGQIQFGDLCLGPTWESVVRPVAAP